MELTVKDLDLSAQLIGEISFGDCLYTHAYEVWQNILDNNWYQREYFYSGDDEGFDRVKPITKKEAQEFLKKDACFPCERITKELKSFIRMNWNTCQDYAREFFADNLIQAAEYLYEQI